MNQKATLVTTHVHLSKPISTVSPPSPYQPTLTAFNQHQRIVKLLRRLFSTTPETDVTAETLAPTPTTSTPATQPPETTTTLPTDHNDVVSASIPKPRNSTDENQYKIGTNSWKKPTHEYQDMTDEQRQEIKERFTLENNQRITGALNRLRSTRGTMAYGQAQGSDSMDGSLPQRNGSMSGDALSAFDRALQYQRKVEASKQQKELVQRQIELHQKQRAEFEYNPLTALETDMGEFSKNSDHLWKREATPEESEKFRAEQIMGKNWMAKWF